VLPGGVNATDYEVEAARAEIPTLICAASLGDPRKRGPLLFEAFRRLRSERPEVRLQLVRTADPVLSGEVGTLPPGAEWVEGDNTARLAELYASAWASVLPSVDEAFGLVLIESLAAGTPAVAAGSGACPDILRIPDVGRLFTPDDPEALKQALAAALELAREPTTAATCRAEAARFDWSQVTDRYEEVYEAVAG
jgi:glycosyltransferase involved in cell wall biosynthesis